MYHYMRPIPTHGKSRRHLSAPVRLNSCSGYSHAALGLTTSLAKSKTKDNFYFAETDAKKICQFYEVNCRVP